MVAVLLVFAVGLLSILLGFRKGMARQVPSLIGVAFGIICARIFALPAMEFLYGLFPEVHGRVGEEYVYSIIARSLLFGGVFLLFSAATSFLGRLLHSNEATILDNIGGAIFSLFKYMLILSIAMNVWVSMQLTRPRHASADEGEIPELMRHLKSDDGNAVEEVMLLGPACLGGQGPDDLAHRLQLESARRIS